MKLCDRCYSSGEYKPGVREITTSSHESFDLCISCFDAAMDFISKPVIKTKPETADPETRTTAKRKPRKKGGK